MLADSPYVKFFSYRSSLRVQQLCSVCKCKFVEKITNLICRHFCDQTTLFSAWEDRAASTSRAVFSRIVVIVGNTNGPIWAAFGCHVLVCSSLGVQIPEASQWWWCCRDCDCYELLHILLLLLLLLLLLSSSSSSSSSSSPLCRVLIFLRQPMSLGNTVLQLFCCYYSWCLYRYFQCWIYCTFTLVLSEVRVKCPIWRFSVVVIIPLLLLLLLLLLLYYLKSR